MGRLSLGINRNKESCEEVTKSKQFRSSIKGFLGISNGEGRSSMDLGDINEINIEQGVSRLSLSARRVMSYNKGNIPEALGNKDPAAPNVESRDSADYSKDSRNSAKGALEKPDSKTALISSSSSSSDSIDKQGAQPDSTEVHDDADIGAAPDMQSPAADGSGRIAPENAPDSLLARYSIVSDKVDMDWNGEQDDRHGWRRRGSILSSRLTAPLRKESSIGRGLMRKESTPLFSSSSGRNIFHRSGSSEAGSSGGIRTSFWRGSASSSLYRGSGEEHPPPQQQQPTLAPANNLRAERTHRSSSVPYISPIMSSSAPRSMASPYLRAVGSGLTTSSCTSSRLNHRDLQMNLAGARQATDRFPKLSISGSTGASGGAAGLPSPAAPSADGSGSSSVTPMTFLVSPRPRASTASKHALGRLATASQEFRLDKRTLSSATIPALELGMPGSPRALVGCVDMSEFGVGGGAPGPGGSVSEPGTGGANSKSPVLLPSPVSASTPARSVASTGDSSSEAHRGHSPHPVHETHRMHVVHDPRTGRKMINQYMIIRELGRGTHGKVKLAFDTAAGEYFAIKIIDKESRDRRLRPGAAAARAHGNVRIDVDKMEKVKREIAILKKCCHPNVVRLHEVIDDAHARRIYLVIEFMDGGEIAWRDNDGMPKMGAAEARSVFRDLVLGVEYLHYVGVLHRDLKPQNLLCNKAGRVKISDFGVSFLSRRLSRSEAKPRRHRSSNTGSAGPSANANANPASNVAASPTASIGASPLRPAGKSAALQGSLLHRYASQPQMGSGPVLQRKGSQLRRQASGLSRDGLSGAHGSGSGSRRPAMSVSSAGSSFSSSGSSQGRRQPLEEHILRNDASPGTGTGMGMTDEFGNHAPGLQPLVAPVCKLPPEIMSADSNVYDPFDSSESDEFFSSDSESESESEYGSIKDNDGGIVFGTSPKVLSEAVPPPSTWRPRHERKGTLDEIDFKYDEKDEERELAKTAGTPAFFAPEMCCTNEELAKVLKDERARRMAHARLVSRNRGRFNTEPTTTPVPQPDCETDDGTGAGAKSVRPMSLYSEPGQATRLSKRHSAIVSLLAFPFSQKSRLSSGSNTSNSNLSLQTSAPLPEDDYDEPLPANVITPAIDIWAMGVTLYCLIYGRVPFRATTEFELFNIIPRQQLEFPQLLEASDSPMSKIMPPLDSELHDLLVRMLDKDFRTRITIDEIKHHPWVVRDLAHPSSWAHETDPVHRPSLNVTLQEVEQAVVPKMRQQQDEEQGFRASLRRRISQMHSTATKTKSSLDWLKIW